MQILRFLASLYLLPLALWGQCPELGNSSMENLKRDLTYLASDSLKGRGTGTLQAEWAGEYIASQFEKAGLAGIQGERRQTFEVAVDAEFPSQENNLRIGEKSISLEDQYFPVRWSSDGSVQAKSSYLGYGIVAPELDHDDYAGQRKLKGKVFVMDISSPDGIHPHSEYLKYHDLGDRIDLAVSKGAEAVVLVNLEGSANDLGRSFKSRREKSVPVIFITDNELAATLKSEATISLSTKVVERKVEAFNVLASIDNGAEQTVLIGAHYDHLGMGGQSSLYRGEPAIHNGADDNASGVAALLELGRQLGAADFEHFNYHLVAFSAEEMGLLGSDFYTKNQASDYAFMLNYDMVGRMEDSLLAVNGIGTASVWPEILDQATCEALKLKTTKSGIGPSDHTNFYYQDIPVLHFFTGTHRDYHKPTDDVEKINFEGLKKVVAFSMAVLKAGRDRNFEFVETPSENTKTPRFSVTLGVMPDYLYEGEGMRIDGVNSDKPAEAAGLKAGDVVKKLGAVKVVDMMSYMKALGQFNKGDEAELKYERDGETFTTRVQF